jgi:hypothetical protein
MLYNAFDLKRQLYEESKSKKAQLWKLVFRWMIEGIKIKKELMANWGEP